MNSVCDASRKSDRTPWMRACVLVLVWGAHVSRCSPMHAFRQCSMVQRRKAEERQKKGALATALHQVAASRHPMPTTHPPCPPRHHTHTHHTSQHTCIASSFATTSSFAAPTPNSPLTASAAPESFLRRRMTCLIHFWFLCLFFGVSGVV